ncbi:hypothetical protein [Rhabdothermincola salaria]|uniref:hypothetical protein n=1 Tax=Rhabdothermincola salaria TaxID=2903142 RepID=UPI001E614F21|nr:hypothetical protein [Rhabdothermincola salaria]MCD9625224.1 hypothetical protein [Rhabdothermincola salaria]
MILGTLLALAAGCTPGEGATPSTSVGAPTSTSVPEEPEPRCQTAGPGLAGLVRPLLRDGAVALGEAYRTQSEGGTVVAANIYDDEGTLLGEGEVWFVTNGFPFAMTEDAVRYSFTPAAEGLPAPPEWTDAMADLVDECVLGATDQP